jgi:hypothetical protein
MESRTRRAALRHLLSGVDDAHIRLSNTFTEGVESLLDSACRMGLEGLTANASTAPIRKACIVVVADVANFAEYGLFIYVFCPA